MSERPNDQPAGDDPAPIAADDAPVGTVADDAAPDGAAEDLAAASPDLGPEADVEALDDGTGDDDEQTVEEGDAALQAAAGEDAEPFVEDDEAVAVAETPARPMRPSERRAMRAALEHGQLTLDPTHRVSDRASAAFVLVAIGAFVLIFLYGLTAGHGGFFTPLPSPTPVPSVTASPVPSPTVAPSGSAAASPTPTVLPTATPAVTSPPPSATPAPS